MASTSTRQSTPRSAAQQGGDEVVGPAAGAPDVKLQIAGALCLLDVGQQRGEGGLGVLEELQTISRERTAPQPGLREVRQRGAARLAVRPVDGMGRLQAGAPVLHDQIQLRGPASSMTSQPIFAEEQVEHRPRIGNDQNDHEPGQRRPRPANAGRSRATTAPPE